MKITAQQYLSLVAGSLWAIAITNLTFICMFVLPDLAESNTEKICASIINWSLILLTNLSCIWAVLRLLKPERRIFAKGIDHV